MAAAARYAFVACNTFAASENPVHHDVAARALGYRDGLVAGVTVYGYLTAPALERLGEGWLGRGTASLRLRRPVFHGDHVEVVARETPAGIEAELHGADGEVAASCAFGLASAGVVNPVADLPHLPLPAERAGPEVLAALGQLGSLAYELRAALGDELLAGAAPVPTGLVHPAALVDAANRLLMANVRLRPWIHTGSSLRLLAPLRAGVSLDVRGRVAHVGERRGRPTVALDVVAYDGDAPVAAIRHEAITDAAPAP